MRKIVLTVGVLLSLGLVSSGYSVLPNEHKKAKAASKADKLVPEDNCDGVESTLLDHIRSKKSEVNQIMDLVLSGSEKHKTYDELALFVDTFGPRLSGSKNLADALEHLATKMTEKGLSVSREKAKIPHWRVRHQSAEMIQPKTRHFSILALGNSVATKGTIEAEVALVHSFDELDNLGDGARDKIVVFNYKFTNYGESVQYRTMGAKRASKYGAKAALIRSVTPFSIYSPHTGVGSKSIPTAALTLEDADMIQRWVERNETVVLRLNIDTESLPDVDSFNVVGDIPGSSHPEDIVLVSGHVDSWYNTEGAMDDGGGMMISYKALDVLKKLGFRGNRTMRAVLWTAEEFGLIGAQQYLKDHRAELNNFKVVMESDEGTFTPLGLGFKNVGPKGRCILKETLALTKDLGTTTLTTSYEGSDIEVFSDLGVPGLSLYNSNEKYFYFHHTSGDSITMMDPDALDKCTAFFASVTYVLSTIDVDLRQ